MFDFKGKTAVITGGAQGIGKCIAEQFKACGADVCVIDIRDNEYFKGDLADKETLETFSKKVIADFGKVDFLINNALPKMCGIDECSYEDFEDTHMYILTNTRKQYGASTILYPGLLENISEQLGEDFYLIPSSIHEFIILPSSYSPSTSELNEMVNEINENELPEDEFLSDHIYLLPYDFKKISFVP